MFDSFSFLCISTHFKGNDFLKSLKLAGNKVYLLTHRQLQHRPWAWDSIDNTFYLEEKYDGSLDLQATILSISYVMRTRRIDRIVALDDVDVETAATLREHFRIPGMGQSTSRHFRDKLAMRIKAIEAGIAVPAFSSLFNDNDLFVFAQKVKFPCVVKPRFNTSVFSVKKVNNAAELWEVVHHLGEHRPDYLVEQFRAGTVYHVDALGMHGRIIFSRCSEYLEAPFDVVLSSGIFRSAILPFGSEEEQLLTQLNDKILKTFGMQYSALHSEYIKDAETGELLFLDTETIVGGVHTAEMVEASSGINLWHEWAMVETAVAWGIPYQLPSLLYNYAGMLTAPTRQRLPNALLFEDPEIYWKMDEDFQVGLIVQSPERARVLALLDKYRKQIAQYTQRRQV